MRRFCSTAQSTTGCRAPATSHSPSETPTSALRPGRMRALRLPQARACARERACCRRPTSPARESPIHGRPRPKARCPPLRSACHPISCSTAGATASDMLWTSAIRPKAPSPLTQQTASTAPSRSMTAAVMRAAAEVELRIDEHDRHAPGLRGGDAGGQVGAERLGIDSADGVVGADLPDDEVRRIPGQGRDQTLERRVARFAADAGVDDVRPKCPSRSKDALRAGPGRPRPGWRRRRRGSKTSRSPGFAAGGRRWARRARSRRRCRRRRSARSPDRSRTRQRALLSRQGRLRRTPQKPARGGIARRREAKFDIPTSSPERTRLRLRRACNRIQSRALHSTSSVPVSIPAAA